jgi:folate-binding protein YgfZ
MSKPFYVELKNRGLVHIEGEDHFSFLQGLVSNTVEDRGALTYACLLTPQGKFLHDFFIHYGEGFLLLDCEGGARARDLYERLLKFKLRAKVTLSVEETNKVYAAFGVEGQQDPRHKEMGVRLFTKPEAEEKSFDVWDTLRISLLIPDGSRDLELEKSTLSEGRIDDLNGIDWKKGCYMGQELTARMKYRGLAKKHLYQVRIDGASPTPFSDLPNGGQMRSSCDDIGLALLKDENVFETDYSPLTPVKSL